MNLLHVVAFVLALAPAYVAAKAIWDASSAVQRLAEALGAVAGANTQEVDLDVLEALLHADEGPQELRLASDF